MPQSRHSHSHSRSGHGGPSAPGAFGPQSRTSSTTSLGSTKRSAAAAAAAAGLGFTQVAQGVKKRPDTRPHAPYRTVSNESDQSQGRTRGKHAPSQSQSTINGQTSQAQLAPAVGTTQTPALPHSRPKSTRGTSQAQLLEQAANQMNGEEDEDEWMSSSGAITPNSSATEGEGEIETETDRLRKAMLIRSSLQHQSRERHSRERERERERDVTVGTPKANEKNVLPPTHPHGHTNGTGKHARPIPPQLERSDTQQTVQVSPERHHQSREEEDEEEIRIPVTAVRSVIAIPSAPLERPSTPPPARSQPEPHRIPTSPHPSRNKAKTRPPSIRSIKSASQHQYTQPHPLIRGSSFHAGKSESPQTPGVLSGPNTFAPLTSIRAPPIVTSSHTSGVTAESPPEMTSAMGLASPTSKRATSRSGRPTSQSSIASVATLAAPSVKRASFALPPDSLQTSTSTIVESKEDDAYRRRKASTASTASVAALSLLARHPSLGHSSGTSSSGAPPSSNRSTWHLPTLPSLGLMSTPPTRPSTPPPLALKLPPQRYPEDTMHEGGSRYRNYLRRKQAQQDSEPDEDESLELEPEEEEEGIGEWIPQPYFAQHLTAIRCAVRPKTQSGRLSAANQSSAEHGVLRQSWRRVRRARAGMLALS